MDHYHNTINDEKNHKILLIKNEIKIWSVGDFIYNFYRQDEEERVLVSPSKVRKRKNQWMKRKICQLHHSRLFDLKMFRKN